MQRKDFLSCIVYVPYSTIVIFRVPDNEELESYRPLQSKEKVRIKAIDQRR